MKYSDAMNPDKSEQLDMVFLRLILLVAAGLVHMHTQTHMLSVLSHTHTHTFSHTLWSCTAQVV